MYKWSPSIPDTLGTASSILIKGGVLISGVVCTHLYVAGTMHSVPIKGGALISGVSLKRGFHCSITEIAHSAVAPDIATLFFALLEVGPP